MSYTQLNQDEECHIQYFYFYRHHTITEITK